MLIITKILYSPKKSLISSNPNPKIWSPVWGGSICHRIPRLQSTKVGWRHLCVYQKIVSHPSFNWWEKEAAFGTLIPWSSLRMITLSFRTCWILEVWVTVEDDSRWLALFSDSRNRTRSESSTIVSKVCSHRDRVIDYRN